ncbi:hypothetical protein GHT06_014767 [Daphnia sinensis]|uniref:Secreted protein n=1 Tax=Daphnia sinensis TaxID=1820382 RepID=A0AAD5PVI7_9CRUS|nr:hypothetical protein GHT06_014767 [Daphnia sinensis]
MIILVVLILQIAGPLKTYDAVPNRVCFVRVKVKRLVHLWWLAPNGTDQWRFHSCIVVDSHLFVNLLFPFTLDTHCVQPSPTNSGQPFECNQMNPASLTISACQLEIALKCRTAVHTLRSPAEGCDFFGK